MKRAMKFCLFVALFSSALQAAASPQDNFESVIIPSDRRCTLSVSNQEVDFGTLSRWQMQETGAGNALSPGQRTLTLSVSCPYSQPMQIQVQGEPGRDGNLRYGQAGSLNLNIYDAQVDGQPVQLIPISRDRVRLGGEQSILPLGSGSIAAASRNGSFVNGKTLTARLELRPQLPESEARVSVRSESETHLTLDVLP